LRDIINLAAPLTPAAQSTAATVETITHRDNAPRSRDEREPVAAKGQPTSLMHDTAIKAGTGELFMELRYSNETQSQLGKESILCPLSNSLTGRDNVTKTNNRLEKTFNKSVNENVYVVTRSRARPDVDADDKTETDVADMDMTEQQADTFRKIDMSDVEIEMPKINTSSSHFLRAQKSDPSLYHLWERAKTNTGSYCVIGNLPYIHTPQNVNSSHDYLLVLPKEYIQKVIQMAHNSGHLGS